MISHEHKCIFIHIPRTGGTSVEVDVCGVDYGKGDEDLLYKKHLTVKDSIKLYGKDVWDEYFTFAFVRNPWERILSKYLFLVNTKFMPDVGFENFVNTYKPVKWEQNPDTYQNILDTPKGRKPVDFIGRFENLQEDFQKICKKIGLNKHKLMDAYNHTYHSHFINHYNSTIRDKVYAMYKDDIQRFNYKFE